MLVHPISSKNTACPGDARTLPQSSNVLVEEPEQVERETQRPREKKLNNWSSKSDLISETSESGERISGVKYPRVQVVRLNQ